MPGTESTSERPFAALSRFARRRRPADEVCELCGAALAPEHPHLVEINEVQTKSGRIVCSCDGCALLFDGRTEGRFRRVPRRIEWLEGFRITDEQWENFHLPINLAFFYMNSTSRRVVAMFPSPAGATESLLTMDAWEDLAKENPILNELQPDVEALLVNRVAEAREYCRVPIDECFKLVGLIRTHWRGLSGGVIVWGDRKSVV